MKKFLLFIVVIVLVGAFWAVGQYNSLVSGKANVAQAWSNVQVQYQRRGDLVPQLVSTVEWAAKFEKSTLTDVVNARAKATGITVDPTNSKSIADFNAAQTQLSWALSRLLVSVEAYPDLKANQNFRDLQSQLEGTENRIGVARGDYNTAATGWNVKISRIPTVFVARLFGFEKVSLFEAQSGTENAPKIEFNLDK